MTERILFVDDDPYILSTLNRRLRGKFDILTETSPRGAIDLLSKGEDFAVVVSDLTMPLMGGIQFLSRVCDISPDTVRVMLTGTAQMEDAVAAVNESKIFRFLLKPVNGDILEKALLASLRQYHLITAERELLENTLNGAIRVMVDILSLSSPVTFSRASRVTEYVNHIATQLLVPDTWQFELAALLSQIGCIMLPSAIIGKINSGEELTEAERQAFASHPNTAKNLLMNVPRLDSIAQMIGGQLQPFKKLADSDTCQQSSAVKLGASMLRVALDYDDMLTRGISSANAMAALKDKPEEYDPSVVSALEYAVGAPAQPVLQTLSKAVCP